MYSVYFYNHIKTTKFVVSYVQCDKSIGIIQGWSHTAAAVSGPPETLIGSIGFRKKHSPQNKNIHGLQWGFQCATTATTMHTNYYNVYIAYQDRLSSPGFELVLHTVVL